MLVFSGKGLQVQINGLPLQMRDPDGSQRIAFLTYVSSLRGVAGGVAGVQSGRRVENSKRGDAVIARLFLVAHLVPFIFLDMLLNMSLNLVKPT